jgi:Porin subfamily
MRHVLLVSAVSTVAVAGVRAADLPARAVVPAEYPRICTVVGMTGFVLPGTDTCVKIGGYVTAQIEAGNLKTGYDWITQGLALSGTGVDQRPSFGYSGRLNLNFDARENTPYGTLRGIFNLKLENGNGFDTTGTASYMNLAYVQWAGITAGKAPSYFSFYGCGTAWAMIFSPDQQAYNQPVLFAYTATFASGFSATVAAQSTGSNGSSGVGTNFNINTTNFGSAAPDAVANFRVDQSWGSAQVSGVAHQVRVQPTGADAEPSLNTWGWGANAGISFKFPELGALDKFSLQASYTKNAIWYSGIPDGMWTEYGAVNGNGLAMSLGDTYYAGMTDGVAHWATPRAWSASATYEHSISPELSVGPEAAYAQLNWTDSMGQLSSNAQSWVVGAAAHWYPATKLDFEFELLYQSTHQSPPALFAAGNGRINGVPATFPSVADGFAGRFEILRYF